MEFSGGKKYIYIYCAGAIIRGFGDILRRLPLFGTFGAKIQAKKEPIESLAKADTELMENACISP